MKEAYIVTSIRTPGCRRNKGAFKDTRPDDLLAHVLSTVVDQTPNLEKKDLDDIMIGCSFPEAEQGLNIGRIASQMAGFPETVSGATVNRFCASGLEAIAQAAMRVMVGWSDIVIGGGVESMTYVPLGGYMFRPNPAFTDEEVRLYTAMGITAEIVSRKYGVSREEQDEFAFRSHMKAAKARTEGTFIEIVPTPATRFTPREDGTFVRESFVQAVDDGIREDTTVETLARLRPVFARQGTVTAGNSSQMTDGAAATVIMSGEKVRELGITPVARFSCYTTVGCNPEEMGVGPRYAIPKLLDMAGLSIDDIGLFEINEAFAAQALYCVRELGIDTQKLNIHGGAIALGHPLGCTGAKLCATLLANMRQRGVKYGVESMCVGGGMGAAALFELID
jgi:acetyl-CoA acyltransferase